jgi:single-strand DNA-binding protein
MAINRVNISGNLTRDGELRMSQAGNPILTFGVAVNDRRRNQQTGEWEEYPNYVDCVLFNNRAQGLAPYLTKGTKVAVEGKLHWSSWEKDGQKRSKLEVYVDEVEFLSARQQNAPQGAPQPGYAPQPRQRYANPPQPPMAPQMAPQAPAAPAPQYGGYQPTQQPPTQQAGLYDEDIPF